MADPFQAFQMGAGLGAGQSTLGAMVRQIVERFGAQQEAQMKYGGELALETAKSKLASQRIQETFGGKAGGFIPTRYTSPEGIVYENPEYAAQQKLAESTATNQAEVIDAAKEGIRTLSQMRGLLQVDKQQRAIGNRLAISRSGIPGMFLESEQPDQRDLRSLQGRLHNFISLVRTGRQGLEQQIPFVQEQYNLGYTDPDETIIERLDIAEQELITRAGLSQEDIEILRQEGLLREYQRRGVAP